MGMQASSQRYLVEVYVVYGVVAVSVIVYLARTLFKHGQVFLEDVFADNPRLAGAVNHLLVIGFYLLNLGYAFLLLKSNVAGSAVEATEVLINKLGVLLLSLGVIHFANLYVFHRIRRRARMSELPPPIAPQGWYPAARV
jgi:hypothetical protein